MQHCLDQGMTEAEALKLTDEAMNSPPRVPLPTLEELDAMSDD